MNNKSITMTPFTSDIKNHWVEGLNNGGNHEFLMFIQQVTPFKKAQKAELIDIYKEGFLVNIAEKLNQQMEPYFYPFNQQERNPIDNFSEQYMGFLARKDEGSGIKYNRQLVVINKYFIAKSFIRLRLQYIDALPTNLQPAFITVLDVGSNLPRAYTYRKVLETEKCIDIDFFTHGQTPTLDWLNQLQKGQSVISLREKNEAIEHLNEGQVLLCGDETAFPAIASILEHWQNPKPPIVILEMRDIDDYAYFNDCKIPESSKIYTIQVKQQSEYGLGTKELLTKINPSLEKVWGAFHTEGMKLLRKFFEQEYQLSSADMVVRVYWNTQKKLRPK